MTIPPLAIAALWFAFILALTAAFFYGVRKWAGKAGRDPQLASDMLTKFRDLHASGGLSDSEYRTIKTKLAPEIAPAPAGEAGSQQQTNGQSEEAAEGLSGAPVFRQLTEEIPKPEED